jgi:hypothetical protein
MMMIEHCFEKISSGKNQNDMMNGGVLYLDFRTKILTSKFGLLTNVPSSAFFDYCSEC